MRKDDVECGVSVCSRLYSVCAVYTGVAGCGESTRDAASPSQRHSHRDERITAARVDRDASGVIELGDSAVAVEEASRAAASERGGHPGGVDTADTVVILVLRCIMG